MQAATRQLAEIKAELMRAKTERSQLESVRLHACSLRLVTRPDILGAAAHGGGRDGSVHCADGSRRRQGPAGAGAGRAPRAGQVRADAAVARVFVRSLTRICTWAVPSAKQSARRRAQWWS
jgi:hypothetical protein